MTIFKNIQLALLLWMFAMLSGVASVTPGAPLKFFIYDDPEWHKMGTFTMSKRHPTERMENVLNRGAGPEINRAEGVYHTNQYQLYNNMYHRALRDPRRTLDPEEATTFFLPYDIASDAAKYQGCPKNTSKTCYDFNKCVLAPKVEKMLLASPYYRRNGGSDHMMLVGLNYAMKYYLGKPLCKKFLSGVAVNISKFCIDDYSYYWASNMGVLTQGDHWHAVPFPADFHFNKHIVRPFPWENEQRPFVASYVGSTSSYSNAARSLKSSIAHFCAQHTANGTCVHSVYGATSTNDRDTEFDPAHQPLLAYKQSVFCFQPIGDLPTRKGLFDGLLMGCIPVVFDIQTAENMYTWHWEQAFWEQVVVRLPLREVGQRAFDPVQRLVDLLRDRPEEVRRKQELLRSRVFELQYSLDGPQEVAPLKTMLHNHRNVSDNPYNDQVYPTHLPSSKHFHNNTWPLCGRGTNTSDLVPCRDAYDIIMELSLGFHSKTGVPDVRVGSTLACWDGVLDRELNKCVMPPPKT